MKKCVFVLCLLGVFSCGDVENEAQEDVRTDDLASQLADAKQNQDGKDDEPSSCGDDTCQRSLCGYDCTVSGQQCERACADQDSGAATVKFEISGSATGKFSSDDYVYEPYLSLNNVLIFGCDLWDFSSGAKDDLVISYREVIKGAFAVGDSENIGAKFSFDISDFQGPGSYQGGGFYSESSTQKKISNYFVDSEGCGFEIEKNGKGISGKIICENLPNKSASRVGQTIKVKGEFKCGADAMDPQFIKLNKK